MPPRPRVRRKRQLTTIQLQRVQRQPQLIAQQVEHQPADFPLQLRPEGHMASDQCLPSDACNSTGHLEFQLHVLPGLRQTDPGTASYCS